MKAGREEEDEDDPWTRRRGKEGGVAGGLPSSRPSTHGPSHTHPAITSEPASDRLAVERRLPGGLNLSKCTQTATLPCASPYTLLCGSRVRPPVRARFGYAATAPANENERLPVLDTSNPLDSEAPVKKIPLAPA